VIRLFNTKIEIRISVKMKLISLYQRISVYPSYFGTWGAMGIKPNKCEAAERRGVSRRSPIQNKKYIFRQKPKNLLAKSILCLLFCLGGAGQVAAAEFETKATQAYMVDITTGTSLYLKEADARMTPSSMTKMLTVYLLFERLKQGSLKLTDQFYISEQAWRTGGSKMFVAINSYVQVEDLLRGIIIQSGNDACVAVAEGLAGNEANFASLMNRKAQELGLKGSHFMNSNGWPNPNHYATARDLAIIAEKMIQNFPEYFHYWAEKEYTYNKIRQFNRNRLVGQMGVDGLKTGHTEDGGFGITLSAKQPDGRYLVLVVNGLASDQDRIEESRKLLQYGINNFEIVTLAKAGQPVTMAQTWFATQEKIPLTVAETIRLTIPKYVPDAIKIKAKVLEPLPSPLPKGAKAGELEVQIANQPPRLYPLYTAEPVEQLSAGRRFFPSLKYRLFGSP
jgi:D-alanyl-D-alanine carboxypeptidase (penicillin-binding protein 5/6)